jgi:hypothetical protein
MMRRAGPEFRNIKRATSQVRPWLAVTSPA